MQLGGEGEGASAGESAPPRPVARGCASAKSRFVHIFSVCCAIAGQLGSIRDGSGRLQRPFSISSFVIVRLTCGFPRRGQGRGASGAPAPATSRKKCARNGAIADKRATNRKNVQPDARASVGACMRRMRPGHRCARLRPASCERLQVEASRSPRPAARNLHQSPQVVDERSSHARRVCDAPSTCTRGDLWRFRKANPQEDEP